MKTIAAELKKIVDQYTENFSAISVGEFSHKPVPKKWSRKEVLGHLIDSAHNNYRRFIAGQSEEFPHIVYDQDFWVSSNDYQNMEINEIIFLWKLMNERIYIVLKRMSTDNYDKLVDTGKEIVSYKTIRWLAEDYIKHLKHHINQIITGSFDIVYP
ncbi:MAG: DinB family protein [Fimbriimonadaceae bacterium]|nr:DinB family protein [Chitinophagales bacterium]